MNYSQGNKTLMTVVGNANQSLEITDIEEQVRKHLSDIKYIYLGGCFKLVKLLPFYAVLVKK